MSSKKKFQKLSLKKGGYLPDVENKLDRVGKQQFDQETEKPKESLSPFCKNFDTPPFVTTSRPKYKKSSTNNSDIIDDSFYLMNFNEHDILSTPENERSRNKIKSYTPDHTKENIYYNMFDSFHQKDLNEEYSVNSTSKTCADDALDTNSIPVATTPENFTNPLSPQSTKIMNSIYGEVWKHTPGLFRKTESKKNKNNFKNEYDKVVDNMDNLSLYVETLTDVKVKKNPDLHLNINNKYKFDSSNVWSLKPKMLSFEFEKDDMEDNRIESNNKIASPGENILMRPDLDASDESLFSVKRVKRKKTFSLSSSTSEGGVCNVNDSSFSDREDNNSGSEKNTEKEKKYFRKSLIREKDDLECTVVLIESDAEAGDGIKKNASEKKLRKLFSKYNKIFDDVEFVSEQFPNDEIKYNRIFEIIDDNVEKTNGTNKQSDILCDKVHDLSIKYFTNTPRREIQKKTVKKRNKKQKEKKIDKENININEEKQDLNLENVQTYSFMASLSDSVPSWRCDKEAKQYRDKFKSKKTELTQRLFKEFNKGVYGGQLDANLPIAWSTTLKTTAGRAYNKIKRNKTTGENIKSSCVELSVKVVDNAQRLRDTLAHELCHVASWMIDSQLRDNHGPYWKKWVAATLKVFPELGSIPVCHSLTIHFKYTFKCTRCGYGINRHSKCIDIKRKACGYCGGRFECIHNKINKDGLVISTPVQTTSRELKGFALYVKENYANVRGSNTPHKQAMQYLGKQYAKMKSAQSSDSEQGK